MTPTEKSCETFEPLLSAHALGELSEVERSLVSAHVSACAACREELDLLSRTAALLSKTAPAELGLEARDREKILAAASSHLAERSAPSSIAWFRRPAGWACAAAALLVVAVTGTLLWKSTPLGEEKAIEVARLDSLESTSPAPELRARELTSARAEPFPAEAKAVEVASALRPASPAGGLRAEPTAAPELAARAPKTLVEDLALKAEFASTEGRAKAEGGLSPNLDSPRLATSESLTPVRQKEAQQESMKQVLGPLDQVRMDRQHEVFGIAEGKTKLDNLSNLQLGIPSKGGNRGEAVADDLRNLVAIKKGSNALSSRANGRAGEAGVGGGAAGGYEDRYGAMGRKTDTLRRQDGSAAGASGLRDVAKATAAPSERGSQPAAKDKELARRTRSSRAPAVAAPDGAAERAPAEEAGEAEALAAGESLDLDRSRKGGDLATEPAPTDHGAAPGADKLAEKDGRSLAEVARPEATKPAGAAKEAAPAEPALGAPSAEETPPAAPRAATAPPEVKVNDPASIRVGAPPAGSPEPAKAPEAQDAKGAPAPTGPGAAPAQPPAPGAVPSPTTAPQTAQPQPGAPPAGSAATAVAAPDRTAEFKARVDEILSRLDRKSGETPDMMFFRYWGDNPFVEASSDPLSTFAVDVDTASYTLTRSYIYKRGILPPREAIRTEEFINYLRSRYAPPTEEGRAFAIHTELAPDPFAHEEGYQFLKVGLKGREVSTGKRKACSLVFVVDTSGSMRSENRLELVKDGLRLLVKQLDEGDSIGIVAFDREARVVMEPTPASEQERLLDGIARLEPRQNTNVAAGLQLGFKMAGSVFLKDGVNRVILCSDGVANTGNVDPNSMLESVRGERERGIYLTCVGVGMGNHNDVLMETLADRGNGQCVYVDRIEEAQKVFVDNLTGTLETIARDVKIQVEFDPARVIRYRLLGYENRAIADSAFRDNTVDAGEVGAGHEVTALYEVKARPGDEGKLATVRVRYLTVEHGEAVEYEKTVAPSDARKSFGEASPAFQLTACVAEFAEVLRASYWARGSGLDRVASMLEGILPVTVAAPDRKLGDDPEVVELVALVRRADALVRERDRQIDDIASTVDTLKYNYYLQARLQDQMQIVSDARRNELEDLRRQQDQLRRRLEDLLSR